MIGTASESKSKITSDLSSKANLLSFHVWFAVARILYQGFQEGLTESVAWPQARSSPC